MFSGATSKFAKLFSLSQMSRHTRCTWELKKIGLLNALPLPPKRRLHHAAATAKLAATAATLPPPCCRYLRRRHTATAAPPPPPHRRPHRPANVFITTAAERGGRMAVAATDATMPAGVALLTPCPLPPPPLRYRQAAAAATALPTAVLLPMTPRCPLPVSSSQPWWRAVAAWRWRQLPLSCHNNAVLPPAPRCHSHPRAIATALLPPCLLSGLLPALGDGELLCVS